MKEEGRREEPRRQPSSVAGPRPASSTNATNIGASLLAARVDPIRTRRPRRTTTGNLWRLARNEMITPRRYQRFFAKQQNCSQKSEKSSPIFPVFGRVGMMQWIVPQKATFQT